MGWKAFKEHFKIEHNVCITREGICIGSGYVHNLAVVDTDTGEVLRNKTFKDFLDDKYPALVEAPREKILELINSEDRFERSLPVYTCEGEDILKKSCEDYGYPNVTHCGELMYDNTYFSDRKQAVDNAVKSTENSVTFAEDIVKECREKLSKAEDRLDTTSKNLLSLKTIQSGLAQA